MKNNFIHIMKTSKDKKYVFLKKRSYDYKNYQIIPLRYDDIIKIRLVFKTTTWLQNLRMRASLKQCFIPHDTLTHLKISANDYSLSRENPSHTHTRTL